MNCLVTGLPLAFLVVCLPLQLVHAQGSPSTDSGAADGDYSIQGEYSGLLEGNSGPVKLGVQVIALGNQKFRAVVFEGGLPGDGWNGGEAERIDGQSADGIVVFRGDRGEGRIAQDGGMQITSGSGRALGQLKRVIRQSPTMGKKPPAGGVVLFDGSSTEAWTSTRGGPARMQDGLLEQGANSKQTFPSHQVHIEFRLPYQPHDRGQARGNSGIYLQGRYEVQMLDSFGLEGKDNECGGIYEIQAPDVNMCLPPLQWQTYDIQFTQAQFDSNGKKIKNAKLTVRHNGVVIHQNVEVPRATRAAPLPEGPTPGFLHLQDHGSPVRYRNIWVVPMDGSSTE